MLLGGRLVEYESIGKQWMCWMLPQVLLHVVQKQAQATVSRSIHKGRLLWLNVTINYINWFKLIETVHITPWFTEWTTNTCRSNPNTVKRRITNGNWENVKVFRHLSRCKLSRQSLSPSEKDSRKVLTYHTGHMHTHTHICTHIRTHMGGMLTSLPYL